MLATRNKKGFCDYCSELKEVYKTHKNSLICLKCFELAKIKRQEIEKQKQKELKEEEKQRKIKELLEQKTIEIEAKRYDKAQTQSELVYEFLLLNSPKSFTPKELKKQFPQIACISACIFRLNKSNLLKAIILIGKRKRYYVEKKENQKDEIILKIKSYLEKRKWCHTKEIADFIEYSQNTTEIKLSQEIDLWVIYFLKGRKNSYIVLKKYEGEFLKIFPTAVKTHKK